MNKIPFFLWVILLFSSSLIPAGFLPKHTFHFMDKIAHFYLYSVLSIFFLFSFRRKYLWVIPMVLVIGAINELIQFYIPGRDASFSDLFFDFLGGGFIVWMLKG